MWRCREFWVTVLQLPASSGSLERTGVSTGENSLLSAGAAVGSVPLEKLGAARSAEAGPWWSTEKGGCFSPCTFLGPTRRPSRGRGSSPPFLSEDPDVALFSLHLGFDPSWARRWPAQSKQPLRPNALTHGCLLRPWHDSLPPPHITPPPTTASQDSPPISPPPQGFSYAPCWPRGRGFRSCGCLLPLFCCG